MRPSDGDVAVAVGEIGACTEAVGETVCAIVVLNEGFAEFGTQFKNASDAARNRSRYYVRLIMAFFDLSFVTEIGTRRITSTGLTRQLQHV